MVDSVMMDVGKKFDAHDRKRRYDAGYYGKTERKKRNKRQNQNERAGGQWAASSLPSQFSTLAS